MSKRILIIDDNPAIYGDFCKVLCPATTPSRELLDLTRQLFDEAPKETVINDYQIDYAQRGQDGVEKVREAQTDGKPYVIAFVDMRMPNGWNGLETITQLWLTDPRLQIVLCTAYSDYSWQEIRERLSTKDRFLILKKPFDNIEVQQMVETLINRQEAEAQLLENRNLLLTAQKIARLGYYTLDPASDVVTLSESFKELFSSPASTSSSFDDFLRGFAEPFRESLRQGIQHAGHNNGSLELICQFSAQGSPPFAWCLAAGHWENTGPENTRKFFGTLQDITQTYELQNQLQLLDACISQANDVVVVTDARPLADGGPRIVYVNDIFLNKTGYSRDYALGKPLNILYGADTKSTTVDKINQARTQEQPIRIELVVYNAEKTASWVDINISPIRNTAHKVAHWLYLIRDISQQKTTLDSLTEKEYKVVSTVARNSEKPLKDVADLLHISEHTLRNHLASIYDKLGVRNRLELYVFCSKLMEDLES